MIFHSPILALLLASLMSVLCLAFAGLFAWRVERGWDLSSGAAAQLRLEKRTYLVATMLKFVMVLELLSLVLFVINADQMALLFTGAMCAVGTLTINAYGIPALLLKITGFFGAAVWLILNHADEQGRDYPLIRAKYRLLMGLAPIMAAAGLLQFLYFYNLDTDVITSCCSRLFEPEGDSVSNELAAIAPGQALWLLFGGFGLLLVLAWWQKRRPRWRKLFAPLALSFFVVSITAIISVISSYIYEQPHHHCPFCILKPEYGYIGFALYLPLFFGAAFGLAGGLMAWLPTPSSLARRYPLMVSRNIELSALMFGLFVLICLFAIWRSNLILFG